METIGRRLAVFDGEAELEADAPNIDPLSEADVDPDTDRSSEYDFVSVDEPLTSELNVEVLDGVLESVFDALRDCVMDIEALESSVWVNVIEPLREFDDDSEKEDVGCLDDDVVREAVLE